MSIYLKKLVLGIMGIYILFIFLSYYTEKIYNHPYKFYRVGKKGQKEDYFTYPSLVTWASCLLCTLYGSLIAKITGERENPIELGQRKKLGLLFVFSILPSNYALLYVSYPLHVVAKASRYFFFILFGAFFSINQKRQLRVPKSKIIIALIIMLSTFIFIYEESISRKAISFFKSEQKWVGVGLLVVAVVSDAFFVDSQIHCKAVYHPTANHLFQSYNFYAFLFIFSTSLIGGTLFSSLRFVYKHPSIMWDIGVMCILQLISQQMALNLIIVNFKQYIYPLISSTRRIIVLIVSIVIFEHNLSLLQWICVALISSGIIAELLNEIKSKEGSSSLESQR